MSETEQKETQNFTGSLVKSARNQLFIVVIAFASSGLWMNYQFLTTINLRIDALEAKMDYGFMTLTKQSDKVETRVEKFGEKLDKVNGKKYTPNDEAYWHE